MKPAPFKYIAAHSLEQALTLKAEYGDEARFLAGGQSLVPTLNFRLTQPEVLIDINPLTMCAGVQNVSRPIDICHAMSHGPPITPLTMPAIMHQIVHGTDSAFVATRVLARASVDAPKGMD